MKKSHGIALSIVASTNILITIWLFSSVSSSLAADLSVWVSFLLFLCIVILLEMTGGILSLVRGTIKAPILTLFVAVFLVSSTVFPAAWMLGNLPGVYFLSYLVAVISITTYYIGKEGEKKHFAHCKM